MKTKKDLNNFLVMSVFLLGTLSTAAAGRTIYVDAYATGANDGSSWTDAYNYLQDALAAASSGDEIWVAQGTYKPDENTANPDGTGDRTATFQLMNAVAIKGGYAGYGAGDHDARNVDVYETILSADLNGDDLGFTNNAENSYHVVTGSGTDATAILDGVTVTSGNANGSGDYNSGGGMYNNSGSPTVTNCIFSGNSAMHGGGGMYNRRNSRPRVINCRFIGNSAIYGAGMYTASSNPNLTNCTFNGNSAMHGGGMWTTSSNPNLTNCTFNGNSAYGCGGGMGGVSDSSTVTNSTFSGNWATYGGGMWTYYSSLTVTNCTFSGNSAGDWGGGMLNEESSPTLYNCTFSGNSTNNHGAGMYNYQSSSPTVTNCTFSGNSASNDGGGMYNDHSSPTLTNCILWGDSSRSGPEIYNYSSTATVTYSDIEGGYSGTGNINADPLFVDVDNGDYHLLPDSPCIDAGTNTPPGGLPPTDIEGNPRPMDGDGDGVAVADMGAYEAITPTIQVAIDIKPGSYPNMINLGSYGVVPAAILSSADFDATTVDADTVQLAGSGVAVRGKGSKLMAHDEDVDGDGLVDLVVQVETENLDPESFQDGYALLTGNLLEEFGGTPIEGSDEIIIVPPE